MPLNTQIKTVLQKEKQEKEASKSAEKREGMAKNYLIGLGIWFPLQVPLQKHFFFASSLLPVP